MVALCPNHHTEYGKLSKDHSYRIKQNPINFRTGHIHGLLGGNRNQKTLDIGGMKVEDCKVALAYSRAPIFSYGLENGEFKLSAYLPDQSFKPELQISSNNLTAKIGDFWDIEFKTNWVKFRRKARDIFLSIDFRRDEVTIEGNLNLMGEEVRISNSEIKVGTNTFGGGHIARCHTAFALGPEGRILPPNFAMTAPSAIYLPSGEIWDPQTIG